MSTTKVMASAGLYFLTTSRLWWKLPVIILKERMGIEKNQLTENKTRLERYCPKAWSCLCCSLSL